MYVDFVTIFVPSDESAKYFETMTKKSILVIVILCVTVFAQETDNSNAKDVETISSEPVDQGVVEAAAAQAIETPGVAIAPNDPNYGKKYFQQL